MHVTPIVTIKGIRLSWTKKIKFFRKSCWSVRVHIEVLSLVIDTIAEMCLRFHFQHNEILNTSYNPIFSRHRKQCVIRLIQFYHVEIKEYHVELKMTQFHSFVRLFIRSIYVCVSVFFLALQPRRPAFSLVHAWKRSTSPCLVVRIPFYHTTLSIDGTVCCACIEYSFLGTLNFIYIFRSLSLCVCVICSTIYTLTQIKWLTSMMWCFLPMWL